MQNKSVAFKAWLPIVLAAICSIALLYLITTTFLKILEVNKEIKVEQQAIETLNSKLHQMQDLQSHAEEMSSRIAELETALPQKPDESLLISELEWAAYEATASLTSIEFGEIKKAGDLNEMTMKLSFTCEYESLIELIESINQGKRLIRTDSVSILVENSGAIRADISASTFYRND